MPSGSRFVVYGALTMNALIAIGKFVAATITGSASMLAEGIHSSVDTGDQALLLLGLNRSRKPPDQRHPFGYGKELYFWSLVVAMIIFGVGGGISIMEGVRNLRHGESLGRPTWNYIVLGGASVFELISFFIGGREFLRRHRPGESLWQTVRRSKDPSVYTVVLEDSSDLIGLLLAFLGVFLSHLLHRPWIDGLASIAIGVMLAIIAVVLFVQSKSLLVGESANIEKIRDIRHLAEADPAVRSIDPPLTMQLAPHDILLNLGVYFHDNLTPQEIKQGIARLEASIQKHQPEIKHICIKARSLDPQT